MEKSRNAEDVHFWMKMSIPVLCTWAYLLLFSSLCSAVAATGDETGDRMALLDLKKEITHDPSGALSSWNDTIGVGGDFCKWSRVTCSAGPPWRVVALNLSSLGLVGPLSPSIGNLTSLEQLLLSNNQLFGEIPPHIGGLSRLEILDLGFNSLQGEIPGSLANLSNLGGLNLAGNQFTGGIPPAIGSLAKLLQLYVANNSLTGAIPAEISNLTSLKFLGLMLNNLTGPVPEGIGRLPSLQIFQASVNRLTGSLPPQIFNISSLWYLAAAENFLAGTFPEDMGNTLPQLETLILGGNLMVGTIPATLSNATSLQYLSISFNNFFGTMPRNLGSLRDLTELDLESNMLDNGDDDWEFLYSLTNCSKLQNLLLSSNRIRGAFPGDAVSGLSPYLQALSIGENELTGRIPEGIGNLTNLNNIVMEKNKLTGSIPSSITNLKMLQGLHLSYNELTGGIPFNLGNISMLSKLYLECNGLQGPIPPGIGNLQHLSDLDLSYNRFNQAMPMEIFALPMILTIYLDNNAMTGNIPPDIGNMQSLQSFMVSGNNLSGGIPDELGNCLALQNLDMSHNSIGGTIPLSLSNLKGMEYLNLSHNSLTGTIGGFMEGMPSLASLDLSFNQLEGEVPTDGIFQNATQVSLGGNTGLCGGITELNLPPCPPMTPPTGSPRILITASLAVSGSVWLVFYAFIFFKQRCARRSKTIGAVSCDQSSIDYHQKVVSYADLMKATEGFSSGNMIGIGAHSTVYKGELGIPEVRVAVKVFDLQREGASKSFATEQVTLSSIRHRNIVKLQSCCSALDSEGKDFKATVYDLMPKGSLESWLHPSSNKDELSMIMRLNILIDVAEALRYLHAHCQPSIVHCDLKPSNVLLDDQMTAHLADFGSASFLLVGGDNGSSKYNNSMSTMGGIRGTVGYIAPEFGLGGRPSTHSDVYSYGIMVLEMLTGRRPVDDMFKDGLDLRRYVEMALPDRAMAIVCPWALGTQDDIVKKCLVSILRVGLSCSNRHPGERMKIEDVIAKMQSIRNTYLSKEADGDRSEKKTHHRRAGSVFPLEDILVV